jgi:hypothetical protein
MRNKVDCRAITGIAVIVAISLATVARAQQAQKPAPAQPEKSGDMEPSLFPDGVPGLEEVLGAALQDNPEIRVAQAKVREAEAALNQARLEMIRQAVTLRQTTLQQQAEFKETKRLYTNNVISAAELAQASRAAIKGEAQLLYLMGRTPPGTAQAGAIGTGLTQMTSMMGGGQKGPGFMGPGPGMMGAQGMMTPLVTGGMGGGGGFGEDVVRPAIPRGKIAEKLRTALDKETPVDFERESLVNMIAVLADNTELNFVAAEDLDPEAKVTLSLKKAPLEAVLQALTDRAHVDFIVRDYGILVTPEGSGPEDGLTAHAFWEMSQPPQSN